MCLQGLIEKDLIYIIGPAEGDRLYLANQVILKVFYILVRFLLNFSAILLAFLALKQRIKMEVEPFLDLRHVAGPSAAVLISAPIYCEL